jgi:monoamine oxidase
MDDGPGPAQAAPITRRRVLGGLAAAAGGTAGWWAWRGGTGSRAAPPTTRATSGRGSVAVVGGGLAGLTAAWTLREAGVEVTLLEASPVLGGRVRTWRGEGWHAEAGGEFIDGRHRDLRELLAALDLPLEPVGADLEDLDGVVLLEDRRELLDEVLDGPLGTALDRVEDALLDLGGQLVDLADPAGHRQARQLDGRSAADLLDELGLRGQARWLAEHELRGEFAAEPEDISLLFLAQATTAAADDEVEGHRIAGGGDQLIGRLAAALGDAVRLGTPVTAVDVAAGGVRVRAGGRELLVDRLVLATSPDAADAVRFEGRVPTALLEALRRLRLGDAAKVLGVYPVRPWRAAGYDGTTLSDGGLGTTWEIPGPGRGLLAFAGASGAPRLAALGRDVDALRQAVGRLWPQVALPVPLETRTIRWADEPWVGGAYSAYAPGQVTALWDVVRRPHGRISVAGEHTARLAVGYMDGAVESGRRAAAEVTR